MALADGESLYFYELDEGDDEVASSVLLVHDAEYDEAELLELVLEARAAVVARFEEDTLSEAIAAELARRHGFLVVDDSRLRAAVRVSRDEGETAIVEVDARSRARAAGDDDFRSILVELDQEDARWEGG